MDDTTPSDLPPAGLPSPAPEPTEAPPTPATMPTEPPTRSTASRSLRYAALFGLAALLGTFLFIGGYLAAGGTGGGSSCAAPSEAFAAFCQAYDKLHAEYVDPLDDDALVDGALHGMFQYGVPDPHSGYMSPEDYQNSLGDLQGTFTGIGAELAVSNTENPDDLAACQTLSDTCVLEVVAPIHGSPAEAAGLQAGDVVQAVDGETVNGGTIEDAITRVRGPEGTDVTLTISRDGEVSDLTITRAQITVVEVESRMIDSHIGYIALHGFSANASTQFHDELKQLIDDGATQVVFDLRDNPGGYITAAQEVASEFVADGLLFTQESSGGEVKRWEATGDGLAIDPHIALVVLVNGGSASASEIVGAALQENDRAEVIGEPSYGKNTVQVWDQLVNGGGVRITISRWFTPDHNSVAPDGIQPDIVVAIPDGTPAAQDPQLDRAIEYLGTLSEEQPAAQQPAAAASAPAPQLVPLTVVGRVAPHWVVG